MTQALNIEKTVGELVAERPGRSRIFERLGIDYCCGGKLPLSEACARKGLDAASIMATLEAAEAVDSNGSINEPDPQSMTLTDLCDHIETTHHAYLRTELPRLDHMTRKVASRHGENHAWLIELEEVFCDLFEEITMHMMKEERVLFPAIRDLEAGRPIQSACGAQIEHPIDVMEHEHEQAGRALARMRELSGGFTPPDGACNTFRAMLDALGELEADLHLHIHKENNVLFPRALERFGGA